MLLGPVWPVPTMYLEGNPKYNHVSSTLIREICREGMPMEKNEALSDLVPTVVAREISELYCPKEKES
jgi:phosphopantetheine adenylyltransferase